MSHYGPLTPNDYPLRAVGPHVYKISASSPLFTAPNDTIAADLAFRLNAYEASKTGHHQTTIDASRLFREWPTIIYR